MNLLEYFVGSMPTLSQSKKILGIAAVIAISYGGSSEVFHCKGRLSKTTYQEYLWGAYASTYTKSEREWKLTLCGYSHKNQCLQEFWLPSEQ